jgi:hypothetical protein
MTTATALAPSTVSTTEEQAILAAYQKTKRHGLEFGKLCYDYREKYGAQGSHQGLGFEQLCTKLEIPRRTAYYWIAKYEESIGLDLHCAHCGSTDAAKLERMSEVDDRVRTGNYWSGQSSYSPRRKIWLCGDCIEPYVLADHNVLYNDRTAVRVPIRFDKAIEMTSQGGDTRMLRKRKYVPSTPDDNPDLAAMFAPPTAEELAAPQFVSEPIEAPTSEAPAMEILPPESKESDLARLRRRFAPLGLDVKKSDHGSKYVLDNLTEAQLNRIATLLVNG